MEKSRVPVKLCEASVGVDCSDVTVTFRLTLRSGLCGRAVLCARGGGLFGCGVLEVQTVFMS